MNINLEGVIRKNIPGFVQPRRSQIYVGFQCHQKCGFCYYVNRCNEKMFPLDYIRKQIDFCLGYGIRDFEITGGEPSEYQELRHVCEYIKSRNMSSRIAVITNGGLWRSDVWDIIDEVLISYHISRRDMNMDRAMFPLGDTFDKVNKTVEKAKTHGKLLRFNTVVATFNMGGLDLIVDDLVKFGPSVINFLPVNTFEQAGEMSRYIDYGKLRPILKRNIGVIREKLPNCLVYIRYFPFCDMKGYERHIVGHLQHMYDWFDWNRELDGTTLLDLVDSGTDPKTFGPYGSRSLESVTRTRNQFYEKGEECLSCRYYLICDGVEKTCDHSILKYAVTEPGKIVKNPMEFIGNETELLYLRKYPKRP